MKFMEPEARLRQSHHFVLELPTKKLKMYNLWQLSGIMIHSGSEWATLNTISTLQKSMINVKISQNRDIWLCNPLFPNQILKWHIWSPYCSVQHDLVSNICTWPLIEPSTAKQSTWRSDVPRELLCERPS